MLIVVCNDLSPAVLPCIDFLSPLFWRMAAAAELLTLPPGGLPAVVFPLAVLAAPPAEALFCAGSISAPPTAVPLLALLIFIFNMFVKVGP